MRNKILLEIVLNLLNKQNTNVVYTFDVVIDILMEVSGYDSVEDFATFLDAQNIINNGNPYFKEAVLHLYKKSKF